MDESLSDTYGYSECSGKPSYNLFCDMPGSCKSLVYTQFEHLSSFTFYFLGIPIRAVELTLRGSYVVLLDLWFSREQVSFT